MKDKIKKKKRKRSKEKEEIWKGKSKNKEEVKLKRRKTKEKEEIRKGISKNKEEKKLKRKRNKIEEEIRKEKSKNEEEKKLKRRRSKKKEEIRKEEKSKNKEEVVFIFEIEIKKKIKFVSIETKYEESLKDLSNNKNIDVIIQKNNINPEIDFKYLSQHLKNSNNYEYLKEALTSQYYKKLYNNKRRNNPFKKILDIFDDIINKKKEKVKQHLNGINFIGYNLPLIYGIERVRFNYYLWLISSKINYDDEFAGELSKFSFYLDYLRNLNKEKKCDQNEIDMIFYQFILEIIEVVYGTVTNIYYISNFYNKINPDFIELKTIKKNYYINLRNLKGTFYVQKIKQNEYYVTNGIEGKNIKEKDYNIEKLANDINNNPFYPLDLLLYRNESINRYYSENKTFIERLGLFDFFKEYFFIFIKSKICRDVFSKDDYEYVNEFLNNDNFKKILLNEKYLKFIPFYNELYAGFTNKDLLLTTISAYPSIVIIKIKKSVQIAYEDFKHFCLLMAIGEKFLALLHEQLIHFIYGYLHHLTDINNISQSPKREENNEENGNNKAYSSKDGGHYFEKQLFGKIMNQLTITNVVALLDGNSINKSKQEFRKIFNDDFNIQKINELIKNCSGFLRNFLNEYPINFDNIFKVIKNFDSCFISTKGNTEPYIKIPNLNYSNDYIDYSQN